jgi:chorismate mutase / prephenate dehydratase
VDASSLLMAPHDKSSLTAPYDNTKILESVDKTSLMVTSENESGALFNLLKPIAENGLSMTRIESRPSKSGLWQYLFFIDIDGHSSHPAVAKALSEIKKTASLMKTLGSYPKAVL